MGERSRWAVALFWPVFGVVLLVLRTAWLAHVHTLSESELHLQVFEHATAIAATLVSGAVGLAAGSAWWLAGRVVARRSPDLR